MQTKDEIFQVWAPPNGRWSAWVKPVLFAFMEPSVAFEGPPPECDTSWIPSVLGGDAALVLDLPGSNGVIAGLELAAHSYRPVPLYNAVPAPAASRLARSMAPPPPPPTPTYPSGPTLGTEPGTILPGVPPPLPLTLVEVDSILSALRQGTERLRQLTLPAEALPVFLLDANRRGEGFSRAPGRFDNRSVSFTTDFPSATFLMACGIRRAVLVLASGDQPQPDLAHTFRGWQQGGISIELKRLDLPGAPVPCQIAKPSLFGKLWYRAMALAGFETNKLGGFGGFIPMPSSG